MLDCSAWLRDAIYVTVGHSIAAVRLVCRGNDRQDGPKPALTLGDYADYNDFKRKVAIVTWKQQRRSVDKYSALRQQCAGAAESYLSSSLKSCRRTSIHLVDPSSQAPLTPAQAVAAVQQDLVKRACNQFPQDQDFAHVLSLEVAGLKDNFLKLAPLDDGQRLPTKQACQCLSPAHLYSSMELDLVLSAIKPSKKTAGCPYAALRAANSQGKRLTLALANLGRHTVLTSSLWSLRLVSPIRKSGPALVRSLSCLRPVSICSDMAHVQDSLWLNRCRGRLLSFCGSDQLGGVSDVISLVIALVVHAQLRRHQGLWTYWPMADLQWAFDVAIFDGMLSCAYKAGIVGTDWLLLHDIIHSDTQQVSMMHLLSAEFKLAAGTAQGRPFSNAVFGVLLVWLRDLVASAVGGPTPAHMPTGADTALQIADALSTPVEILRPPDAAVAAALAQRLRPLLISDVDGPRLPATQACLILAQCRSLADRILAIEMLGSHGLGPLQFADDLTAPCGSPGAVVAVIHPSAESACSKYAMMAKAIFNYKSGKSAVMAMYDSPALSPDEAGCDVLTVKRLLGVLVDKDLCFTPLLSECVAKGWSCFQELLSAAQAGGFSLAVVSAQVLVRVQPGVLFAAAFLVCAKDSASKLNRLQFRWATALLGCADNSHIPHAVLVAQCGWPLRLATRMLEDAAVQLARLFLLPSQHPAARMLLAASQSVAQAWPGAVLRSMQDPSLPQAIPPIWEHQSFTQPMFERARGCPMARKALLKRYRWSAIRPIMVEKDRRAFLKSAERHWPWLGYSFSIIQPLPELAPRVLLDYDAGPHSWVYYRSWALARATGCWPLQPFGIEGLHRTIGICPLCGAPDVPVSHPMTDCHATADLYERLSARCSPPSRDQPLALMLYLFGHNVDEMGAFDGVTYVGKVVSRTCHHHLFAASESVPEAPCSHKRPWHNLLP